MASKEEMPFPETAPAFCEDGSNLMEGSLWETD